MRVMTIAYPCLNRALRPALVAESNSLADAYSPTVRSLLYVLPEDSVFGCSQVHSTSMPTCIHQTNPCVDARQVLPLLTPTAATAAAQLLLKLYPLQQPLLSRHATDALGALVSGPGTASISAGSIAALLDAVLSAQDQAGERQGADVSLAVVKLLEGGLPRWATQHVALTTPPGPGQTPSSL